MENEIRLNFDQVAQRIQRGEVVKLTHPIDGITHPMTRPNQMGGYVSFELLSKQQIMEIYQARQRRIDSEAV